MSQKLDSQTPQAKSLPREEHLRLLVESATDFAMLSLDTQGRYDTWSAGAERILGYTEEEALGQYSALIFTPEDREKGEHEKEMQTALREGRAEDERWHLKKDGSRFFASGVMTPLYDPDTKMLRGFGKVLRDITDKKRTEEALRESAETRAFLAAIIDSSQDSVVTVDFGGVITSWNRAAENIYGYPADEALGKPLTMLVLPADLDSIKAKIDEVKSSCEVAVFDAVRRRKDGEHIHLEIVMSPVKDAGGNVIGVSTLARDVTERRRTAEELERQVAERTAALHAGMVERQALMGRVVRAQEEERRRISRELHDSTGQYMTALSLELGAIERTAAGARESAMQAARAASAAARVASDAARIAEDAAGKTANTGATLEAARLAGVASEAARAAAIAGTDAGAAAAAANAAVAIVDQSAPQVARLRELTASLSRDIHSLAVGLRPTSLDDLGLVPALTALCEDWARRSGVAIDFEQAGLGAGRLASEVETTVYRVVQEALTNATRYAVPSGATSISVTLQRFDSHVQAIVEDNGLGFDVEEAQRKGRLGLSGMRERAELAGGSLEIESSPGSGTTVYLRVPINVE